MPATALPGTALAAGRNVMPGADARPGSIPGRWPHVQRGEGGARRGRRMTESVHEGDLLWTPGAARVAGTNLTAFLTWLAERGRRFGSYEALWQRSGADLEG